LDENEKAVTSTMINNYVKLKIITPPNKRKYDRKHVCQLFIIILLKKVFSVTEISLFLNYLNECDSFKERYNSFCEQVEYSISMLFGSPDALIQTNSEDKIIETVAFAFACKLYANTLLRERKDEQNNESDNK
jgi:DNA-binding transcriptional MerR regulator